MKRIPKTIKVKTCDCGYAVVPISVYKDDDPQIIEFECMNCQRRYSENEFNDLYETTASFLWTDKEDVK